ncbi:hypothetical protein MD484_g5982, partial [Candolleomyces efflorescens]
MIGDSDEIVFILLIIFQSEIWISASSVKKAVDVIEKASSNKEEVKILKTRCSDLGSSIVNATQGRDTRLLSEHLKDSIGRLVEAIQKTLETTNKEKSKGFAAYLLAEDDTELLKSANKRLDELLQCFQLENWIAGTIVLESVLTSFEGHYKSSTLDKLKRVSGAAYDSHEVAGKIIACFEGTRSTLLANVGRWMIGSVSGGDNPPIYVLDGIAGIGKSTVAITIAQRAAKINCLGASFVFSRDQNDRRKAFGFVHTIAYQLAHYEKSYGKAIAASIADHPNDLDKILTQQFDSLVAKPLWPLLVQRAIPLVLVIDALDECVEPDASAVLDLIINSVSKLPNIKVFLTSRPERKLRSKYLLPTVNAHILHLQEIEDMVVEQDIALYVDHSLSESSIQECFGDLYEPHLQPTAEDKAQLAKLSGKLFIFASTAIKFILDEHHLDPKGQLARLLNQQPNTAKSPLHSLYSYVLQSAKPANNPQIWLNNWKIIVGAILVLQTPLSAPVLTNLLGNENIAISSTLANLHSILAPVGKDAGLTYKVHHKSFPDFVTGRFCPAKFRIVEKEHHLQLAKCCLQVMNQQLRFNICQVPVPSDDQFKDLDELLKKGLHTGHISDELQYAACYWVNHLGTAKDVDSSLVGLLETFLKEHLMHWFEVLSYIEKLGMAYEAFRTLLGVMVCEK